MNDAPKYTMGIELGVLDHLGLNLYSNIPAVLAEAVANAWDADATEVVIAIDRDEQTITILDNGHGMDLKDVNDKFLSVGYRRREEEPTKTKRERHVMGRKGIGKLSLFSIAERIEVHSLKTDGDGNPTGEPQALALEADAIRTSIEAKETYHPEALNPEIVKLARGTQLTLTGLKKHATAMTTKSLRVRLARRFSVIGPGSDFEVSIDGDAIGVKDRDYFGKIEYLWSVGDVGDAYNALATNGKRTSTIDGIVDAGKGWKVTGWVGTFDEQQSIEEENNALTVLAWGKLVQENLLSQIQEGGLYTKYLIGEIRADFLDLDEQEDITTSDRQRLKEEDDRFEALIAYVQGHILKPIGNNWRDWRRDDGMDKALQEPAVDEWYASLKPGAQKFAKQLFGRIGQMSKDDDDARRALYKHGILAFERLRFKESLDAVDRIEEAGDLELLNEFVAGFDDLEAAYYHQIVQGRLEVIRQFEKVVDTEKESVIQAHIFEHLWLLHPSWERASTNARIEESVTKEFDDINAKLSDEEKRGRIDIRYRTAAGKNIIIELKKYDRKITLGELTDQLKKYQNALKKVLKQFPEEPQDIETIAILGPPIQNATAEEVTRSLGGINARVILYDQLIKDTQQSYAEYLEANTQLSRISEVLDKLDRTE